MRKEAARMAEAGSSKAASGTRKDSRSPKKPASKAGSVDRRLRTYAKMVQDVLSTLKERNGTSRQAIQKYMKEHYDLDLESKSVVAHIKTALTRGVQNGDITQTKGTGAQGSFRLGTKTKKTVMERSKEPEKKKGGERGAGGAENKKNVASGAAKVIKRVSPKKAADKGGKIAPQKAAGVVKKVNKTATGKDVATKSPKNAGGGQRAAGGAKK